MTRRAVLALGSNLGDRLGHLQGAVDALAASAGVRMLAVSPVVETDPVGGPEQPDFLNAVVLIDTDLEPLELLEACQAAERGAQRVRDVRWGPRTLDVDVIAMYAADGTSEVRDGDRLTLPHPRAHIRGFVLVPWASVDPDATIDGQSVAALAAESGAGVRPRPDLRVVMG